MTAIKAIRLRLNLDRVYQLFLQGVMQNREYMRYHRVWAWSSDRSGGQVGIDQQRLWDRDQAQFYARIERCKAVLQRVLSANRA